ncbi:MAG: hypothetical protein HUJ27_08240 [Rhodobacteraceae bacterium]|nr:hypothetical protein [Paracoccaceae bacterium]
MKQAGAALILVMGLFQVAYGLGGYQMAYQVGYGAITLMAVMISLTFLWLWQVRATPLALGMSFSWAGSACVMGWWWMFNLLDQPVWAADHWLLLQFLSLYVVGAALHFSVIQASFGGQGPWFLLPVGLALGISALIHGAF